MIHQSCIGELLRETGSCPCGNGVHFSKGNTVEARKRLREASREESHLQLNETPQLGEQRATRPLLKNFFDRGDKTARPTIADLWAAMSNWSEELDRRELRRDAEYGTMKVGMAAMQQTVAGHSTRLDNLEKKERNEDKRLPFEIVAAGIPGDRIPDTRKSLLAVAKYLKVPLKDSDIDCARYMIRDSSSNSPKLHTMIFRLHQSGLVAELLSARKGTATNRPDLSLRAIFPTSNMPDRKMYLRPLLSAATIELLKHTKAARVPMGYKYAWGDDRGDIWMKKDNASQPKQIYSLKTLERLRGNDD